MIFILVLKCLQTMYANPTPNEGYRIHIGIEGIKKQLRLIFKTGCIRLYLKVYSIFTPF